MSIQTIVSGERADTFEFYVACDYCSKSLPKTYSTHNDAVIHSIKNGWMKAYPKVECPMCAIRVEARQWAAYARMDLSAASRKLNHSFRLMAAISMFLKILRNCQKWLNAYARNARKAKWDLPIDCGHRAPGFYEILAIETGR